MYSSSSFQGLPANAQVGECEGESSRGASVTFLAVGNSTSLCARGFDAASAGASGHTSVNSPTCTRRSLILRNSMPAAPVQARPNHNSTESELCFESILQQPG